MQAFAHLSDKLEPLVEGVRENRQHWLELDQQNKLAAERSNCLAIMPSSNNNHNNNNNNLSDNNNDCSSDTNNDSDVTAIANSVGSQRVAEDFDNDSEEFEKEIIETNNVGNDDDIDNGDGDGDDDDASNNIDNQSSDCADDGDDEQDEDEDDVVCVIEENHSDGCYTSASSHISTPPPTGEDDDLTTPATPFKLAQAKLIAANLNNLNQPKTLRTRSCCIGCKKCECGVQAHHPQHNNLRKVNSLKNANEPQNCKTLAQNGCSQQSKSTPLMTVCGVTPATVQTPADHQHSKQQPQLQPHPHHHHHHHHHHNHHQHSHAHKHHHQHNHHQSSTGAATGAVGASGAAGATTAGVTTSTAISSCPSECDKIPKIVGKLANVDSMQQLLAAANSTTVDGLHHHQPINGLNFTPNGHFNYVLPGNAMIRRHSETNRPGTLELTTTGVMTCDK